jgi:phosphatidylinositol 4-kinase
VQAVRWDTVSLSFVKSELKTFLNFQTGYITSLIANLSSHSQLLAHQLLWNMRASMYTDEEAKSEDPILYKPLKEIFDKV